MASIARSQLDFLNANGGGGRGAFQLIGFLQLLERDLRFVEGLLILLRIDA